MADELSVDIERRFASGASVAASFRWSLDRPSVLVLFGPSGAGKTTILRAIAGLDHPDRGTIRCGADTWFDDAADRAVPPQRRSVGHVGQAPALFPHLTVRGNIEYGIHGWPGIERRRRLDEMLALLDLTALADRLPRALSGGQAQRVAIARAVAPRPRLLLLDEPFTAIDAPSRRRLRAEVRDAIRAVGLSTMLVTHDRAEAIALGDEMAIVIEGRVRQFGPVADVLRRPANLAVAESVGVESVIPGRIERIEGGLVDIAVTGATIRAADAGVDSSRPTVFACIRAEDVVVRREGTGGDSARNHFPGRIVALESEGLLERVTIDCGFPLVAVITRNAREEMAFEPGTAVVAAVKATAVHVVARA